MADKPASDRTEEATPERLRKSREEGQVPQSAEVPSAAVITVFLVVLALTGQSIYHFFIEQFQHGLSFTFKGPMAPDAIPRMLERSAIASLYQLVPVLVGVSVASVLGSLLISGWNVSFKSIEWKFDRLSPVTGFGQLFSLKSLVQLPMTLAKVALIGLIVYVFLRDRMDEILALQWYAPAGLVAAASSLALGVSVRIVIGLGAIAGADLLYRRWQHLRDLRMTKQEVKEERKRFEMPAEIKMRMRTVQMTLARKRMLQKVRIADVVVTNPTHVAVALKYDSATMAAPVVVAKGADLLAQKIRELAAEHNVPIIQRPEVARALYANVELDHPVPETLFTAVAEVLAMIHRLSRRRQTGGRHA